MPDTHLVMPRTLSAPYAELLEAETPQTMTASDAPPNGTAAAAAAFARLLASGDHAMQPDSYTLTSGPALPPQARDTEHHSSDLRATLLGSTAIPAGNAHPDVEILKLGLRRAELIERIDQPGLSGHDVAPLLIEWKEVDHLIMELQPKTAAGLAVQLSVIWRQFDLEPGEERGPTADSTLDRVWLWTAMRNAERIGVGAEQSADVEYRQDPAAPVGHAGKPRGQTRHPSDPRGPAHLRDARELDGEAAAAQAGHDRIGRCRHLVAGGLIGQRAERCFAHGRYFGEIPLAVKREVSTIVATDAINPPSMNVKPA